MASTTQSRSADPPVQAVLDAVPKCVAVLRAWADRLERRRESFLALEGDLGALLAHTEQLSAELENSRPTAPVHKNAVTALRGAVTRTAKVFKEMQGSLEGIKDDLMPPSQFRQLFEGADRIVEECSDYVEANREGCLNCEAGDAAASSEKKEKKAKKAEKERKRSNSPKRVREPRESRTSSMVA